MDRNPNENIEKLIKEKNVQFREFALTEFSEDNEKMIVEGVACVFNSPTVICKYDGVEYKEQVSEKAFADCDMSDTIFNVNHCGRVFARTRNNSLQLSVQPDGLHMRAELWADDDGHEQLYRDIKRGNMDKMSFAFTVCNEEYDSERRLRTITGIDRLFDVSCVDIPAYNATSISARSFFDSVRAEELAESERKAKELELAKAKYNYFEN